MANTVTYLLGAGASYNAIPIVSEFNNAIKGCIASIEHCHYYWEKYRDYYYTHDSNRHQFTTSDKPHQDDAWYMYFDKNDNDKTGAYYILYNSLIGDLQWLLQNASMHASIDTFAKKLWLQNKHQEYAKLKKTLSILFLFLENVDIYQITTDPNGNPIHYNDTHSRKYQYDITDYRYDSFFASTLNRETSGEPRLPNVNIISWNYDNQIEKAIHDYVSFSTISDIRSYLNLNSHIANSDTTITSNGFQFFKLNGTASIQYKNDESSNSITEYIENIYLKNKKRVGLSIAGKDFEEYRSSLIEQTKFYIEVIRLYDTLSEMGTNAEPEIEYAWDERTEGSNFNKALNAIRQTRELVIIGYSFPNFNRKKDTQLFRVIGHTEYLKKIVIQEPSREIAEGIKEAIISMFNRRKDIEFIESIISFKHNVDQFYIPEGLLT